MATAAAPTHLHDLPEPILITILEQVPDTRSRNAVALVCRRWRSIERSSRTSLSLRGNVRDLFFLPNCFTSVTDLDLSLLSPWGHPFLHLDADPIRDAAAPSDQQLLLARRLRLAFPNLASLTVYARTPTTLAALAPEWPELRHAALVRWHQRPHHPVGSDLAPLLAACPSLSSLDLSRFYCWAEDIPPALQAHPSAAASLTRLNLLAVASSDGFRSSELLAVVSACRNLRQFLVPCVFNPRYIDFVGDDALIAVAAACPQLTLLHLVDPATLSPARSDTTVPAPNPEDAGITGTGLAALFAALPQLEDLALDPCHHIRGAGPALESLGPRIRSLKLGYFHGICTAVGLHLDGVAVCGRLESLCINNCPDFTDASLVTIARGCRRLSRFQIHGSGTVTEMGIKKLAGMLRPTLVDVSISNCSNFDATVSLRALEPIRECIERLHIDCIWVRHGLEKSHELPEHQTLDDEFEQDIHSEDSGYPLHKKCRFSAEAADHWMNGDNCSSTRCGIWGRLRFLSLWVPAGELLSPLTTVGLEICPSLEEICIKVEGDCRTCPRPVEPFFGLSFLAQYPELVKMKLDCGEAIGYALTAPTGHIDLSQWERFYLHGIGDLNLQELDYWPPQDRDVNQRSLTLPATSLIQGCVTLRKLFIHGTTHEHFLRFFLKMPRLRDVQLREDYYPAPENDMSTEMRVGSCSRFEDALNNRPIPD